MERTKSIRFGFSFRKRNVPQFIFKNLIDLRISLVIPEAVTCNLTAMMIEKVNYTAVSYNHKAKLCKRMINYKIKEGKADNPVMSGEAHGAETNKLSTASGRILVASGANPRIAYE